jgi:hypothetical protein
MDLPPYDPSTRPDPFADPLTPFWSRHRWAIGYAFAAMMWWDTAWPWIRTGLIAALAAGLMFEYGPQHPTIAALIFAVVIFRTMATRLERS